MDTDAQQQAPPIPEDIDQNYLRMFTQSTAAACSVAGVLNELLAHIRYQDARIAYLEREVNGNIPRSHS